MAADPEGRELKFYSQFQTEEADKQNPFEGDNCWPSYFERSDSFLSFSSPAEESELGSYEIESDKDNGNVGDDDYTAELSRRMAQYMLQDDDNSSTASFRSEIQNKSWGLSGSPISTLWSPLGSSNGSSYGSPEGPSKEPSPPSTPVVAEHGGLEISHNVFSKLEDMKKVSTNGKSIETSQQIGETGPPSSKDQARALKNQKRKQKQKQQQFMKQRDSAAIQAKQARGSSSQANSVAKTGGSSGTGVFLPRHVNYHRPAPSSQPPQPPKKKEWTTRQDKRSPASQHLEKQRQVSEPPHMALRKVIRKRRRRMQVKSK